MRWIAKTLFAVTILGSLTSVTIANAAPKPTPFYLKAGDRVVFYGDSITDQRLYTTYIESYCVSRFPAGHFTFVHSGWGGDRVTGGGGGPVDTRLKRDVLAYHPTVVTICLGMNDGSYRGFDQGIFDTYVKGYRHILDTLIKELPGVRITLLTASAFDDVTRAPGFPGGYNATLVAYGEAVKSLGREYGLTVADTNGPLVGALARALSKDPSFASKVIPDRVHPGPGGHLVMASAVLKAWNAPTNVAKISLTASGKVTEASNTKVSQVMVKGDGIAFTANDFALPWPLDRSLQRNPDTAFVLGVTDIEQTLNAYTLKVSGLKAAKYKILVDGTEAAIVDRESLEAGLDLAGLDNLASSLQSQKLLSAIRKHNDIHFNRWRQVQITRGNDGLNPDATTLEKINLLDADEAKALSDESAIVAPTAHRYEVVPAG